MVAAFRRRALITGLVVGGVALGGLAIGTVLLVPSLLWLFAIFQRTAASYHVPAEPRA